MIRNLFLTYKSKSKSPLSEHVSYAEATSIGVLYHAHEFDERYVQQLMHHFSSDGKKTSSFGFSPKADREEDFFSKKDISPLGSIKKENLQSFIHHPFDFLISLNTTSNVNYRYILALCNSPCKVGIHSDAYQDLLQMSLQVEKEGTTSIPSIVKYIKLI